MNKNEREELMYDVSMAMLKSMSHGSVLQYASDRMIQILVNYDEEQLQSLLKQYSGKGKKEKPKKEQKKKKEKGIGF